MSYTEEYKINKQDYMVLCGEKKAKEKPCDKAVADFAKKMHINVSELDPNTRANLKRIICGEKVK